MSDLKISTLNACWRPIWPEVVEQQNVVEPINFEDIVSAANAVGGEGFADLDESDVNEFVDCNEALSESQLLQLANEMELEEETEINSYEIQGPNDETHEDEISQASLKSVIEIAERLKQFIRERDLNSERSANFSRDLTSILKPYITLQKITRGIENETDSNCSSSPVRFKRRYVNVIEDSDSDN